jgi:hypothetical protein
MQEKSLDKAWLPVEAIQRQRAVERHDRIAAIAS